MVMLYFMNFNDKEKRIGMAGFHAGFVARIESGPSDENGLIDCVIDGKPLKLSLGRAVELAEKMESYPPRQDIIDAVKLQL